MRMYYMVLTVVFLCMPHRVLAYPASLERPDELLTRAEAAALIASEYLDERYIQAFSSSSFFSDVKTEDWFAGYVNALHQSAAWSTNGKNFLPHEPITLQDLYAAALAARRKPEDVSAVLRTAVTRSDGLSTLQSILHDTYRIPFWNTQTLRNVFAALTQALEGVFVIEEQR